MTYGEYRRAKPRINVLRGYPGNEPLKLTRSAQPASGQAILSGMLISLNDSGQWILGVPAGKEPFFAMADYTDTDVLSSGLLVGLSCNDKFQIETGYVVTESYVNGSPLKAGASGNVGSVDIASGLDDTNDIIGFASGALTDVSAINTQATPVGGPVYTLILTTSWMPKRT